MSAPVPPQGNQSQRTERPLKVYAEQYLVGAPLPIGVLDTAPTGEPMAPHLFIDGVFYPVHETDWVISNRYSGQAIEVISHEEMSERFGTEGEAIA